MQVTRDAVWESLSELDRRRILHRSAEVREVVDAKLDQWRGWIGPLDHAEPRLPERLLERLRLAYVAQELQSNLIESARRVGQTEPFLTWHREASDFIGREWDAVTRELFGPPELATIVSDSSDDIRLSAAARLAESFGAPLHRFDRQRFTIGVGLHGRGRDQVPAGCEAARRKNLYDAEKDFAKATPNASRPGGEKSWERARTWAMCAAVLSLKEPRGTVWFPDREEGKRHLECSPPFVPYGQTFWPILQRWLRNAYSDEYLERLDVDTDGEHSRHRPEIVPLTDSESEGGYVPDHAESFNGDLLDGLPLSDTEWRMAKLVQLGYTKSEAASLLDLNESYPQGWSAQMRDKLARAGRLP